MPADLFVELPDLRLHLRTWPGPAAAAPVVLLPATGDTAEASDVVAAALSLTRIVYAVDLPGHGSSDWSGRYFIEGMAEAVVALLGPLAADTPIDLVPQIDRPARDWATVLADNAAPTLVIAGGASSPVAAAHVAELAALVADGRYVTVEAGHLVHANEPEAFVRELLLFDD